MSRIFDTLYELKQVVLISKNFIVKKVAHEMRNNKALFETSYIFIMTYS